MAERFRGESYREYERSPEVQKTPEVARVELGIPSIDSIFAYRKEGNACDYWLKLYFEEQIAQSYRAKTIYCYPKSKD